MSTPYSADKNDLYYPAKNAHFFPNGRPKSDNSLCAEMSRLASCQLESSFAFDQPRIRKVLGLVSFTDCMFFETTSLPDQSGSHALLALDEKGKLAVLSFRGTDANDPTDLFDDFDAIPEAWRGGGKVHSGFANALEGVLNGIDESLKALKVDKLLFTGHSLGAAMATLAASLHPPSALYTIGSPRVGDKDFVNTLKDVKNYRYVDCCDLVTQVPPESFGYVHISDDVYYIDFNRAVNKRSSKDPYIGTDRSHAEIDYLEHYAWRIGDVAVRSLADHAPCNYVWPIISTSP